HPPLLAYAQGVNDRIAEAESTHQLDAMFTLVGYQPKQWTPIDTLVIKGDMTQTLSFDDTPILVALINKSLGADLTSEWFPVLPPNRQSPYNPGPYPKAATAPIETMRAVSDAEAKSAAAAYEVLQALPKGLLKTEGTTNNRALALCNDSTGRTCA